ncbi:MAG: hypothetical protein ABFR05_12180 [Bacteroidota bacterium]
MRKILLLIIFFSCFLTQAQTISSNIKSKTFSQITDTLHIDSLSISPNYFKVFDKNGELISQDNYKVDFAKARLILKNNLKGYVTFIKVEYEPLPDFLTKKYTALNKNLIVPKTTDLTMLYSASNNNRRKDEKLFDGIYSSGSLSRGVTFGNNQDAVVNSNFNLQIEGSLGNDVGIRASITDNNIPLQEGGYTQRLDEFDRVFIELFAKNWNIKAGDIDLYNRGGYFMKFNKKIAGINVDANIKNSFGKTNVFASGGLVRGKFTSYNFVGIEGSQGPYKILGENNEQYFLIVSGSETVYANGVPLKRGENFDYMIDYNTGEISFTSIYPVNSNMRFTVDFQVAENNYTRFVTYDGVKVSSDKLQIAVKYYNETDAKSKTIQQDLNEEQKQILADAGDDKSNMASVSAVPESYSDNKILYKKVVQNGSEFFVYSNNPEDELYGVRFSYVGPNNGNYNIQTTLAPGRVYEYVLPVNDIKQGEYAPVILLVAPQKLQIADLDISYQPTEKSLVKSELAFSNKDQNLFSGLDDDNNNGFAGKINWQQIYFDNKWKLKSNVDYEHISDNFQTVERYRNVEFGRDWNINYSKTDLINVKQQFFNGGFDLKNDSIGIIKYEYQNLKLGDDFTGNRHVLLSDLFFNNTQVNIAGSVMNSDSEIVNSTFYRWNSRVKHNFRKSWLGGKLNYENNEQTDNLTKKIDPLSHKIAELEGFYGFGDSTAVFTEIGYNYQKVDSVRSGNLTRVNNANTFYIHSKLIQKRNTDLSFYGNLRLVDNMYEEDEKSLNSRLQYRQNLWDDLVSFNTVYETNSGTLPEQEFIYVEVEPGKGFYNWIDFNNNEIQELDEFVIAKFQDEATFVRVLLPSVKYIKTNQNKWSLSLNLNANKWQNSEGFKKFISHFSERVFYLINANEKRNDGSLNFNPFNTDENDLLALDLQFKNSLFFNRGLQKFSTGYIYYNTRKKSLFSFSDQDNHLKSHQLQFNHKLGHFWLLNFEGKINKNISKSDTYFNRNYILKSFDLQPKVSFIQSKNMRMEALYSYKDKENQISDLENLKMHVLGANIQYNNRQKLSLTANFNWINNTFIGDRNSPVAYQMLEGLQPGNNATWLLTFQKRLTAYLDLNLNYFGRKSENSNTIHTGSVQLRASF